MERKLKMNSKKKFYLVLLSTMFLVMSIPTVSAASWNYFGCGERRSLRNVVASTRDGLISGATCVTANSSLADGKARISVDNEEVIASTTAQKRDVEAYMEWASGHQHSFKAIYG